MGVFEAIGGETHEEVVYGHDPVSGLKTIIAIYSTALGPALGGTRFYPYRSEEHALRDVLRLSKGMALKSAAAGLDLGGGKAVIIGDPRTDKSEELWRAYGRIVESLGGRYITAEDVGTDVADMLVIRRETQWVNGIAREHGGSGDPSPATARGLVEAMRAVAFHLWGNDDLGGRRIAVQGVGKVGSGLVERLTALHCEVVISDVLAPSAERLGRDLGVKIVGPDEIFAVDCDILAPCSLGGVFNADTIPGLSCRAIVGAANNQLETPADADRLAEQGILFAPDFVVNAGGLINVADELRGYSEDRALHSVNRIYDSTLRVLETAAAENISPNEAAVRVAEARIAGVGRLHAFARRGPDRSQR